MLIPHVQEVNSEKGKRDGDAQQSKRNGILVVMLTRDEERSRGVVGCRVVRVVEGWIDGSRQQQVRKQDGEETGEAGTSNRCRWNTLAGLTIDPRCLLLGEFCGVATGLVNKTTPLGCRLCAGMTFRNPRKM